MICRFIPEDLKPVLKSIFKTITLLIVCGMAIAQSALAVPSIAETNLIAQVNYSSPAPINPSSELSKDNRSQSDRSATGSQRVSQRERRPGDPVTPADFDDEYDQRAIEQFDRELYGAGK